MPSESFRISTEFLPCGDRRLFTILLEPEGGPIKGSVLFLPPFADEMHKSRRTVAMQARAMAAAGFKVLLLDLTGCGDSTGSFADASWPIWKEDARCAISFLAASEEAPLTLWGLRLGALLACDLEQDVPDVERLLLWQPNLNGEQYIDQFLRFELAGQALKGELGFDRAGLWNELRSGRSLEVAGYELSSQLGLGISQIRLGNLQPECPIIWVEVGSPPRVKPTAGSKKVIDRWTELGVSISWQSVEGEPFWRNVDAGDSPALWSLTEGAISNP